MKHKYIESLLSEIKLLASKVEILKESKRVPFSFFKESFKRTQEISRLLHELEFVQIEEMRGEMEKLVQYLSDTEKTKKEAEDEAKYLATIVKKSEVESEKEKEEEKQKRIVVVDDATHKTETEEKIETEEEILVAKEDQEVSSPIVENKEQQQVKKEAKLASTEKSSIKESLQATQSSLPSQYSKSEKVLADIVPKNKSLNDVLPVSHTLQDSKATISLNDRFLFQRELFDNNRDAMNMMLTKLQAFSSFDLAESYLKRNTTWDFSNETVDKFLQMLKDRF